MGDTVDTRGLLVGVVALGAAVVVLVACVLSYRARLVRLVRLFLHLSTTESPAEHVVIITDAGEDLDDEMTLVMARFLIDERKIELKAVVANLQPAMARARLVRGTLDHLGLQAVPVGVGTDGGSLTHRDTFSSTASTYIAPIDSQRAISIEPGRALLHRVLASAADRSITLLCISSLKDAAVFLRDNAPLCQAKLKCIVVMGGIDAASSEQAKARALSPNLRLSVRSTPARARRLRSRARLSAPRRCAATRRARSATDGAAARVRFIARARRSGTPARFGSQQHVRRRGRLLLLSRVPALPHPAQNCLEARGVRRAHPALYLRPARADGLADRLAVAEAAARRDRAAMAASVRTARLGRARGPARPVRQGVVQHDLLRGQGGRAQAGRPHLGPHHQLSHVRDRATLAPARPSARAPAPRHAPSARAHTHARPRTGMPHHTPDHTHARPRALMRARRHARRSAARTGTTSSRCLHARRRSPRSSSARAQLWWMVLRTR